MNSWPMTWLCSVDARTSLAWAGVAAGFCYFAWLAIRRFFEGRSRGRASIIAFSVTGIVVAVTAVLIRTNTFTVHDRVTEARTELFALALWWMIYEFRRGNITMRDQCPGIEEDRLLYEGSDRREPGVPGRRFGDGR